MRPSGLDADAVSTGYFHSRENDTFDVTHAHQVLLVDAAVPAPPLHDTSRALVYQWLRDVQAGLWSRREQLWMARRVVEAFHAERSSAEAVERTRRSHHRREEAAEQRRAGTWWADQDAHRRAQRPARFTVDDATWERHRRRAEAAGVGLGEHLGAVLELHAGSDVRCRVVRGVDGSETPPSRFIRIAIDDTAWADLKAAARNSNPRIGIERCTMRCTSDCTTTPGRPGPIDGQVARQTL